MALLAVRAWACENDTLTVSCDEQLIQIINAHYGRLETDTCGADMGASPDTECLVDATLDIVRDQSVARAYSPRTAMCKLILKTAVYP